MAHAAVMPSLGMATTYAVLSSTFTNTTAGALTVAAFWSLWLNSVALVVAETIDQARDAVEAIEVEWTPLPAVIGVANAVKPGAPQVWPDHPGNVLFDVPIGDKKATDAPPAAPQTGSALNASSALVTTTGRVSIH